MSVEATIPVLPLFPNGTVVGLYDGQGYSEFPRIPPGAPLSTATVAAGAVTFTGLTENHPYFAAAEVGSPAKWQAKRFIPFATDPEPWKTKGPKGDRGERGEQGERGTTGNTGSAGGTGSTGPEGPRGEKGEKGATGSPGSTGEKGEKGATGSTGSQGEKGEKGEKGSTGSAGPEGPRGLQGERGEKGEKGEKGEAGTGGASGVFDIMSHGGNGNGTADNATALTAAITAATEAGGGIVSLPAGTFVVNSTVTLPSKVILQGAGKEATIIKLGGSKNVPILRTSNFEGGSTTGGSIGFGIRDIGFDGNKANNTTMTTPVVDLDGLAFFIDNVYIFNGKASNLRTQMSRTSPNTKMEAFISNVFLEEAGKTNYIFLGPHDSVITNLIGAGNGTEANILVQNISNWTDCHVYGNSKYGFQVEGYAAFNNCDAEGSTNGHVLLAASGVMWNGGRVFYGGGTDGRKGFLLKEGATSCQITGVEVANCTSGAFIFEEPAFHGAKCVIGGIVFGEEAKAAVTGTVDETVDFSNLHVAAPMTGPTQGGTSIQIGIPFNIPGTIAAGEQAAAIVPLNENTQTVKSFAFLCRVGTLGTTVKAKLIGITSGGTSTTLLSGITVKAAVEWHELNHTFTEEEMLVVEIESISGTNKNFTGTLIVQYEAP